VSIVLATSRHRMRRGRRAHTASFRLRSLLPWGPAWVGLTLSVGAAFNRYLPDYHASYAYLPSMVAAVGLWAMKVLWEAWRVKY
jgi:hypothetical protein